VPLALYSDRQGIFVKTSKQEPSLAEQLNGRRQLTQVGRLLGELQVELILARSPQPKGHATDGTSWDPWMTISAGGRLPNLRLCLTGASGPGG